MRSSDVIFFPSEEELKSEKARAVLKFCQQKTSKPPVSKADQKLLESYWFEAAEENWLSVLDCLIKSKTVAINQTHNKGLFFDKDKNWSALTSAAHSGHSSAVRLLLKYGADINQPKKNGATALLLAAQNGHLETVEILLENKDILVDKAMNNGQTPLFMAVNFNYLNIVKALFAKGASIHAEATSTSGYKDTPLTLAKYLGYRKIERVLRGPRLLLSGHSKQVFSLLTPFLHRTDIQALEQTCNFQFKVWKDYYKRKFGSQLPLFQKVITPPHQNKAWHRLTVLRENGLLAPWKVSNKGRVDWSRLRRTFHKVQLNTGDLVIANGDDLGTLSLWSIDGKCKDANFYKEYTEKFVSITDLALLADGRFCFLEGDLNRNQKRHILSADGSIAPISFVFTGDLENVLFDSRGCFIGKRSLGDNYFDLILLEPTKEGTVKESVIGKEKCASRIIPLIKGGFAVITDAGKMIKVWKEDKETKTWQVTKVLNETTENNPWNVYNIHLLPNGCLSIVNENQRFFWDPETDLKPVEFGVDLPPNLKHVDFFRVLPNGYIIENNNHGWPKLLWSPTGVLEATFPYHASNAYAVQITEKQELIAIDLNHTIICYEPDFDQLLSMPTKPRRLGEP